MAAIDYMQFYPADYLSDTAHLSTVEHGAYLLLIMNYWQRGKPLPSDPARLARIAGLSIEEWEMAKPALSEFFEDEGGEWIHPRIETDLERVKSRSAKAKRAGEKSGRARKATSNRLPNERSTNVQRTLNERATIEKDIEKDKEKESIIIHNTVCAELREDANSPPPVLTFPTNGDPKSWGLEQKQIDRWRELYPGVDVPGECRKALAWIEANPTRRKTARGMNRFLTNWLGRSNDRGGFAAQHSAPSPEREDVDLERRDLIVRLVAASNAGDLPLDRYRELNVLAEGAVTRAKLDEAERAVQEELDA